MSDEDLKILAEDLIDFFNALEASCVKMRMQIAKLFGPEKAGWDPAKIKWQPGMGVKGPFEWSDDINNPEFKAMLKDLAAHKDRMNREGYFYWVYPNGATVGRKKRGA
jgi:hypothetical protein